MIAIHVSLWIAIMARWNQDSLGATPFYFPFFWLDFPFFSFFWPGRNLLFSPE
jgi:hypothetical protein